MSSPGGGVHRGLPQVRVHLLVRSPHRAGRRHRGRPGPPRQRAPERRAVPRQPDDVDAGRSDAGEDVRRRRHLEERGPTGVVGRSSRIRHTAGTAVSSAGQEQLARGPGLELDAAVLHTTSRGHGHQPVAHGRLLRPPGARPGLALGRGAARCRRPAGFRRPGRGRRAPCRCACVRARPPGCSSQVVQPGLVRAGERRQPPASFGNTSLIRRS